MTDLSTPILYSFRRCPYAMRARMGIWASGMQVELREVALRNKPDEMIAISPKATVPVLCKSRDFILEESLDVMKWALSENDPMGWRRGADSAKIDGLIAQCDGPFKHHLDRYKYAVRYVDVDAEEFSMMHRARACEILANWNEILSAHPFLLGDKESMADIAIFPFVRQFAHADKVWFDAQPWPALQKWLAQYLDGDLFAAIMTKYTPWKMGDAPIYFGQF
ncbi:glutathione S-transferase [Sphingorhabdus lutea]|uniref:Glutathione S-transferase n=1 Tax=Sphingorhabdus lutea TaxID=1913578 RepID=A0A1L3JEG9_9SPHN|nr:glutathione S-transferase [Sphingorhabdus lutea]APG63489.1 glutathione S-transferase [Sphingorhabdus lutea]